MPATMMSAPSRIGQKLRLGGLAAATMLAAFTNAAAAHEATCTETVVELDVPFVVEGIILGPGTPPLHRAAVFGNPGCAIWLISEGADVHAEDADGRTPLHWAAAYGHNVVVGLLLDEGADVDAVDYNYRMTPLHYAAVFDNSYVVELLIDEGADANAEDSYYGRTPLDWAEHYEHYGVAELLRRYGG